MKLFHYHYWTEQVEEMEQFYVENGFSVTGRFAKGKTYHPPLTWDDFREEEPVFRIIEVRRGKVNVTFGAGKKPIFDHIGYLVNFDEHDHLCKRAEQFGWNVQKNERRTFLSTPFGLRVELQVRREVVEEEDFEIRNMLIETKKIEGLAEFRQLFQDADGNVEFVRGKSQLLREIGIEHCCQPISIIDPCGVKLRIGKG
ncbi:hypothetical protein [Alkalihalobacillus sp. AL-G]|uniref:hypothetical protein n=1 Tax=Alkalihalobacillus sp. AL-G TaxID=2926399 RepID=UPI00272CB4CC|nr:hypothetical protein [Alkalihalobacillus sp. AL-G]WLD92550.1 hypothetical protein MOJ78_16245 [Alkalihalobacillus sp. AL-G]